MKTTLELPDALVKQIKLRAVRKGQKLKEAVTELLRKGLHAAIEDDQELAEPVLKRDRKTGLLVVQCPRAAHPEMTPDRVADILLAQEVEWALEAGR